MIMLLSVGVQLLHASSASCSTSSTNDNSSATAHNNSRPHRRCHLANYAEYLLHATTTAAGRIAAAT